MEQDCAD